MKQLCTLFCALLFGSALLAQVDVGATSIINPTTPVCGNSNQPIDVVIFNYSATTINFAINNVTVNVSITGASIQTFNSPVISSGSLASGASMVVNVTPSCNLSAVGTHTFNATTVNFSDVNAMNNAMAPTDVIVTAQPTPANAGGDQSFCVPNGNLSGNTPLVGIGTWTLISGSGVVTSPNSPSSAITGLGVGANTFRWTISNPPCPDSFDDVIVIGEATPTIVLTSAPGTNAQTLCVNNPVTPITYTIGGSATGAFASGLPGGVNGIYTAGTFTISGTPSVPGTYNYTITTTGGLCTPVVQPGSITVDPDATIALTSAAGTDAQTICINNSITPITYTIGGGGSGATASGLPAGVSGTYLAGNFTISGTPTVAGSFNYTVTTTGLCSQQVASGSITVTPDDVITLSSGTLNQTICQNTPIGTLLFAISGGGTGATVSGLPAGITGTFAAGVFTISGSSTVAGTFNYTVTTTGPCLQSSINGTIIVNPDATIALTSAVGTDAQTVCINNPITAITYSVGGGGTGATVSGLPAGISGVYAAGTVTISGTPTVSGTFNYTVTTTGTCNQVIASGSITVQQDATLTLMSGNQNQTICENTFISSIVYNVGGGATGASVSGLPSGVTGTFSAGVFTISGPALLSGVYNFTVTTTGACVQTSANGTLTIDPDATLNLSSAPATTAQTVCVNNAVTAISYSVDGGGTGATINGLPAGVSGTYAAGIVTINGTPTIAGTYNYMVATVGTCLQDTAYGTITVTPDATIVLSSAIGTDAQNVCENTVITNIDYLINGGGSGATFSGLPAGVSGSFSGGIATISGTPTLAGIYPYTINTTGSCVQTMASGSITVTVGSSALLTSGAGTDSQSVCVQTPIYDITYTIGGSASGATVTGLPSGVTSTFSAGILTISGSPDSVGVYNYTVTTSGGSCPSVSVVGSIQSTIQTIVMTSAPFTNDQILCENTAITPITYNLGGSATGAIATGLPAGVTGSFSAGIFTLNGLPTETGTFFYTVTSTGFCTDATLIGSIQINPLILGNSAGTNTTICENGSGMLIGGALTGGNGVYTYLWEESTTSGGLFSAAYEYNTLPDYEVEGTEFIQNQMYYRRIATSGGCVDTSSEVVVTLDSLPIANFSGTATICAGDVLPITGASSINGIFSWCHNGAGILSNAGSLTPVYTASLADEGSMVTLKLIVNSNNTCAPYSDSALMNITITPLPVAISSGSSTICPSGNAVTVMSAQAANGIIGWTHNGNGVLLDSNSIFPTYTASVADAGDTVLLQLVVSNPFACQTPQADTAWYSIIVNAIGNTFVEAGTSETISIGNSVDLSATGPAIIDWNWFPATGLSDPTIPNPVANPVVTTTYLLTGTDVNGCMAIDSLVITVESDMNLMIANTVTPNDDNKNDTWIVDNIEFYPNTEVTVINREGEIVYESDSYDNSWGGTYKGKLLPDATYYYVVKFADSDKVYKGAVTILHH
ncbi:MAG: gliding motility-associated C-terminal domain-containing protein [Fluviicola sp.]|nr:gliding motility-associated C-terminal domain-containing protein [Fluviicola sp.]